MAKIFTENNFKEEVLGADKPVLVDFYADWCGPCKMMAPVIDELAADFEGKADIGKLNVDESGSIAQEYKVMSIPTLIIFNKGEVVEKIVGATSKSSLTDILNRLL